MHSWSFYEAAFNIFHGYHIFSRKSKLMWRSKRGKQIVTRYIVPFENHPEKTAPAGIDLHIGWQISCHSTRRLLHEISNYLLRTTAKNYRVARFKDILKIRDNILITCNTIKIFGVAKKPRGLYCRTKLKTIEWQIHHISTWDLRILSQRKKIAPESLNQPSAINILLILNFPSIQFCN